MYLTMNRFKVASDRTAEFEEIWAQRDSHLKEVPGFVSFALMKGPEHEDHVLYASHTVWKDEQSFVDWTKSEAFRAAHKGAGTSKDLYLGPPELEIFEAVQVLD
ncbi:antibiotic biosynthesis monooxygenase family protein [Salipiger mucosus]|uniref:Putative, distant similarity with heme-degrading oxygenase IsdG n=1 Tax=Salipiger mucosus DSM 16094 TaxID=1123237 RepID=S9RDS0_9RHOB|nr:antibiotic biosynthesis monooxygenase [Salipiger mucosus]EPX76275.1 putative, distant similarity with heme-degrading oxygenase IsdG [Salipiger mucosus DSM 16094]